METFGNYEMNQIAIEQTLPNQIQIVKLKPSSDEYKYVNTEREKYGLLNGTAKRLRVDKENPLIADVFQDCIVVLPHTASELRKISIEGLKKRRLTPVQNSIQEIDIGQDAYQRMLLRSIEIMLRSQKYIVRESRPSALQYTPFSTAYVYSNGLSTQYFEVYRGFTFRLLVFPKKRRATIVLDPKFKFLPRLTLSKMYGEHETSKILSQWGGISINNRMAFNNLSVVDVCPIRPEDCHVDAKRSPYESDCKIYNEKTGTSLSWPRFCYLKRIMQKLNKDETRIRQWISNAVSRCKQLSDFVNHNGPVAEVSFSATEQMKRQLYYYPLERLRKSFTLDLIPDFVFATSLSDHDIREVLGNFDSVTKPSPDNRRFWTEGFVKDFKPSVFGELALIFDHNLTKVSVRLQ